MHEDEQEMIEKYTRIIDLLKKNGALLDNKTTALSPLARRQLIHNKAFIQFVMNEDDYLAMMLKELNAAFAVLSKIV